MLLLVLILVLLAFGLLVVALLSGSVLWAWVSVGVSVAAAAVLLVDWLQRRSAVRAGAAGGSRAPAGPAPGRTLPHAAPVADIEPVTEVIPIVPLGGGGSAEALHATGDDERADGHETVVLPAVRPSGSTEQPSGAVNGTTPSSGDLSRSVTDERDADPAPDAADAVVDRASDDAAAADQRAGGAGAAPDDAEETAGRTAEADADDGAAADDDATTAGTAAGSGGAGSSVRSDPPGTERAAAEPVGGTRPADVPDVEATAVLGRAGSSASRDLEPADSRPADRQQAGASGDPAGPPGESAPGSAAAAVGAVGRGSGAALPPLGPDGAPPEEPRDADVAALVAGLGDEVLVVDEMPRYHIPRCPSLAAAATIPLPAREAVELGFTPCAWCTPDRALSSRHHAGAR